MKFYKFKNLKLSPLINCNKNRNSTIHIQLNSSEGK